jgi:PhnB protein
MNPIAHDVSDSSLGRAPRLAGICPEQRSTFREVAFSPTWYAANMKTLLPYLHFPGNCEAALAFYSAALGGKVTRLSRFSDGPMKVPETKKQQIRFLASDGLDEREAGAPSTALRLTLEFTDRDEQERVFAALAGDGGSVKMPLSDQFWGARFGMVVDRYGFTWMLNAETPK